MYNISKIEKLYPNWYDNQSSLSCEDQKWIWENVPLPEEDEIKQKELEENGNGSVSGNGSGTYKEEVESELNWYRSNLILQLKQCDSNTSSKKIAYLLENIFKFWPSDREGHWLWIAQTYTARTINWLMSATIKKYLLGGIRKTPPAYFIYLSRFRKVKKEFRNTSDTH